MKIQPVRGTHDLYGKDLLKFRKAEALVRKLSEIYDFDEIITPIFESTELFKKPLGEQSDVVLKEMYTFGDRNDSSLTLRPEHTTPVIRSAISNSLLNKLPQRFYSIGPAFRRERPQKGRYRQFNQINFEILGTNDVVADLELILLADKILKDLFPEKEIDLNINSLGDKNTLKIFKEKLGDYFEKYKNDLSDESQSKIKTNPIRILDSKNIKDKNINENAPKISDFYSNEAINKFMNIQDLLSSANIKYKINNSLVRGLDYYCHTVFEFKTNDLGAQDTLIGGGRYDGLVKILGGPDIPGVGWAGGLERIMMLMQEPQLIDNKIYVIIIDEKFKDYGVRLIKKLREEGIHIHFDYKYNLKKSLSLANQKGSKYAIIIGESEVKENFYTIKYLQNGTQEKVPFEKIIKVLNL